MSLQAPLLGLDVAVAEAVRRGVTLTPTPTGVWTVIRDLYEQRDDPFSVWDQYRLARRRGREIPDWVLGYLDRAAAELETVEQRYRTEKTVAGRDAGARFAADVARALQMKLPGGAGTVLTRRLHRQRNELIAWAVRSRVNEGTPWTNAVIDVAKERGLKEKTVTGIYSTFKPHLERQHREWTHALEQIERARRIPPDFPSNPPGFFRVDFVIC